MRECLFYFKAKGKETPALRAVIMVEDGTKPKVTDFVNCFGQLGYRTVPENEQRLTFRRLDGDEPCILEVTKLRFRGEPELVPFLDGDMRKLLKELIQI